MGSITTTSSTNHLTTRRGRVIAIAACTVMALSACGADDSSEASTDAPAAVSGEEAPMSAADATEAAGDAALPATGGAAEAGLPIDDFGRDIIRSVGLTMSTSNVRDTTDDIRRLAAANGGAIFSSDVTVGDVEPDGSVPGGGQIVVRIPPQDLDALVTALDGAGFVTRLTQDSADVTDQLVDLDIRIRQSESGIERIEVLLEQATDLDTVFAIENELTARQVELEQLRAAQRNTEDLVDLATLTISIDYRAPADLAADVTQPDDGIGDAFATGWGAFVGALFAIGFVLAVAAPFLLAALAIGALVWLVGKRWSTRHADRREAARQAADLRGAAHQPTPPPPSPADRVPEAAQVAAPTGADANPME